MKNNNSNILGFLIVGAGIILLLFPNLVSGITGTDGGNPNPDYRIACDVVISKGVTSPTIVGNPLCSTLRTCGFGDIFQTQSVLGAQGNVKLQMSDGKQAIQSYDIGAFSGFDQTLHLELCTKVKTGNVYMYDQFASVLDTRQVTVS